MIRVRIGNWGPKFHFRCSRPGVSAWELPNGDDAIFHEDQAPVAAVASGTWHSAGNDRTLIHLPQIDVVPYMVLMNPGDGNAMLDMHYYAEWQAGPRRLLLVNRQARKSFAWAVLADVGGSAAHQATVAPRPSAFDRGRASDEVAQLFRTLLGREPDGPGLNHWVNAMQRGLSLEAVAAAMRQSDEFRTRATDQITQLFRTLLGREPDGPGLNHWVNAMQQGMSLDAVAAAFRQSLEYRERQ